MVFSVCSMTSRVFHPLHERAVHLEKRRRDEIAEVFQDVSTQAFPVACEAAVTIATASESGTR
jgi:hypothetical protein